MADRTEVIVVGAGQTGLVAGYYLAKAGLPFLILDAGPRAGDSWRQRWDSLELFTIAQYCALPGLRFPGRWSHYPSKDEMADYVETYARTFELPIRFNTTVTSLDQSSGGFTLQTNDGSYEARNVIVATGAYRLPHVPAIAHGLSDDVFQVHTGRYRNPAHVPGKKVVVVGAANSGAQIAVDLSKTHQVLLSQGSPLPHFGRKFLGIGLHWWGDHLGIIKKPLIGERDRLHRKTILVGASLNTLSNRHGFQLTGRTMAADGRSLRFEDGNESEVDAVVWATGFRYDFSWIHTPGFDDAGLPIQDRGLTEVPGLHYLGLQCQYSYGSALIWWVKDDASYLVDQLVSRRSDPSYR